MSSPYTHLSPFSLSLSISHAPRAIITRFPGSQRTRRAYSHLSDRRGRKAEGAGVEKDKELKLEETETSHTLG